MKIKLNQITIKKEFSDEGTDCYKLIGGNLLNDYYMISEEGTRRLMNSPEVIGFEVYKCLLKSTSKMMGFLYEKGCIANANILSILRGALNFPIEESCHYKGIPVHNMSFVSCERVFDDEGDIKGLASKYSKINVIDGSTLLLGDIIASGETLKFCMESVIDCYREKDTKLKNIIIYTIGGTKGIDLLEKMTYEIRKFWPDFEGFTVIYYEGVFSCYEPGDKGVSGINKALIDFIWKDGIITPEFRHHTLRNDYSLFEKCIIYDGGARRYEINEHIEEVLEFWEGILSRADIISFNDLIEEKIGHPILISFEDWVKACHYQELNTSDNMKLYLEDKEFIDNIKDISLSEIARRRIEEFKESLGEYYIWS